MLRQTSEQLLGYSFSAKSTTARTDKVKNLTFITGGVRSGKSLQAEKLASESGLPVYYLATMKVCPSDIEQLQRVEIHRKRRPDSWHTHNCPQHADLLLRELAEGPAVLIFDCLSLYVSNILLATDDGDLPDFSSPLNLDIDPYQREAELMLELDKLLFSMEARTDIEFIVVSNEVGWGVVPESRLGRAFRDLLGLSNQKVASRARRAFLVCSGLVLGLKQ